MTPTDINDLLTAVSTTKALPAERVRELQSLLIKLSRPPLQFRPALGEGYITNGGRWCPEGEGAAVLHLAVHNPDQWVSLADSLPGEDGEARPMSLRAWRQATTRARDSLIAVDAKLAAVFASSHTGNGEGIRFQMHEGRVQVKWRPPPGRAVSVGVPLPCP